MVDILLRCWRFCAGPGTFWWLFSHVNCTHILTGKNRQTTCPNVDRRCTAVGIEQKIRKTEQFLTSSLLKGGSKCTGWVKFDGISARLKYYQIRTADKINTMSPSSFFLTNSVGGLEFSYLHLFSRFRNLPLILYLPANSSLRQVQSKHHSSRGAEVHRRKWG